MARAVLPPLLAAQIMAAARQAHPRECCGLLIGTRTDNDAQVLALHPARNLSTANDRFEIDPRDQFAAQKAARADGHAVIGCYHSHPGGMAMPSATDARGAVEQDFLWLIAAGEALAGFVYSGDGFRKVALGAECVTSSE